MSFWDLRELPKMIGIARSFIDAAKPQLQDEDLMKFILKHSEAVLVKAARSPAGLRRLLLWLELGSRLSPEQLDELLPELRKRYGLPRDE